MILTLHKQTKLEINMPKFIECILYLYRLERQRPVHSRTFYNEIDYTILAITGCDISDYDNPRDVMQTLMKNACIYAIENDYSQADIDMLKGIIDLL